LYVTIHVTTSRDTRDYARSPVKVAIARGSRIEWDSCPGAGLRNFRIAGNTDPLREFRPLQATRVNTSERERHHTAARADPSPPASAKQATKNDEQRYQENRLKPSTSLVQVSPKTAQCRCTPPKGTV
jgi:hypothetical protein